MPITDANPPADAFDNTSPVTERPAFQSSRNRRLSAREQGDWASPEAALYAYPAPPAHSTAENPSTAGRVFGRPRPIRVVPGQDMVCVPHWDDDKIGIWWDYVQLGQYTFTGLARIDGEGPRLSVDRRRHKGAISSKLITNGYDTTELQIILRIWTVGQLRDFEGLMNEIQPKRTGKPVALKVYHPALALARIDQILVYGVGFLQQTGTQGLYECKLRCFEFVETTDSPAKTSTTQTVRAAPPVVPLDPFFHTENDRPQPLPPSATAAQP